MELSLNGVTYTSEVEFKKALKAVKKEEKKQAKIRERKNLKAYDEAYRNFHKIFHQIELILKRIEEKRGNIEGAIMLVEQAIQSCKDTRTRYPEMDEEYLEHLRRKGNAVVC